MCLENVKTIKKLFSKLVLHDKWTDRHPLHRIIIPWNKVNSILSEATYFSLVVCYFDSSTSLGTCVCIIILTIANFTVNVIHAKKDTINI